MRSSFIILFCVATIFAARFDYIAAVDFIYDSNIPHNTTETGGGYVVPRLKGRLYFEKLDWLYLRGNFAYDSYVIGRDQEDNTPFLDLGVGAVSKGENFSYRTELRMKLYVGMGVYTIGSSPDEAEDWVLVERAVMYRNSFRWDHNRLRYTLLTDLTLRDFGDSADVRNEEDALLLEVEPQVQYRFKKWKKKPFSVKRAGGGLLYEGNFAYDSLESYDRWNFFLNTTLFVGYPLLFVEATYGYKRIRGSEIHPHDGDTLHSAQHIPMLEGVVTVPIVKDLSFEVGGKLRFREGNLPSESYSRHTAFARVLWDSRIGKYTTREGRK